MLIRFGPPNNFHLPTPLHSYNTTLRLAPNWPGRHQRDHLDRNVPADQRDDSVHPGYAEDVQYTHKVS